MTTQATPSRPRNGSEVSDHLTTEDEVRTLLFNRVSWGAVLAGVMVALVTQLILNLIGIAHWCSLVRSDIQRKSLRINLLHRSRHLVGPLLVSWQHWQAVTQRAVCQESQRKPPAPGMG